MNISNLWETINNISAITGIITFCVALYGGRYIYRRKKLIKKQKNKWLKDGVHGVLIVQICSQKNEAHIRPQISSFCAANADFKKLKIPDSCFEEAYLDPIGANSDGDISDRLDLVKSKYKNLVEKEGVTKIHWFYKGPCGLAALIGGMFANCPCMFVYQQDRTSGEQYRNWGPLRRPEP